MNRQEQARRRAERARNIDPVRRGELREYRRDWQRDRRDKLRALGYKADVPWSLVKPEHQEQIRLGQVVGVPSTSLQRGVPRPGRPARYKPRQIGNDKWKALDREEFFWKHGRKLCKECGYIHIPKI